MKPPALEKPGPGTWRKGRNTQSGDIAITQQGDHPRDKGGPHGSVTETEQIHNLGVVAGMRKNNVAPELSTATRSQELIMHQRVAHIAPIQILSRTFDTGTIPRAYAVCQVREFLLTNPAEILDPPWTARKG